MIRPTKYARAAALLSPMVLLVAGCGSEPVRVTDPPADTVAHPVVAVGQSRSVLDAVDSALVTGVDPKDTSSTVDARLLGPFRELSLAEARIAAERKKKVAKPAELERLRLIVPTTRGWPRFFVVVGNTSETSTPVLRVLTSSGPRAPYGLWAAPALLPGATLPETASAATGSPQLEPDAEGLVESPAEVLKGFASYLNAGATSSASKQFRRSIYSDQLQARLTGDRKALKAVATVSSTHTVGSSEPLAVRTADGGALVFGQLRQKYVVTVKKGKGKVKVSDEDLAALAGGKKEFSKSFTRTAVEIVALYVPPSSKGLITVIGAQKGDVKAVAK